MAGNPHGISLEPAARAFADATSEPPSLHQMAPETGRKTIAGVQDSPIFKPVVDHTNAAEAAVAPTVGVLAQAPRD
ncbi:hypothetical protein [Nocardia sp. NPDC005998]|uniref:hypothetical protein n=1 Tax=Nocardia sp. NPDC005998 TaxID=3156894 RepID=UPI00339F85CE